MHRRILATVSAMVCVFACLLAVQHSGPTSDVYTAAARIPPGSTIASSDVHKTAVPTDLVPAGAITSWSSFADQMTTGPIPAGAILTADNFVAASQAANGFVILPLTVSPQVLAIVKPGDHVSIFVSNPTTGDVSVARGIRVITIPAASSSGFLSTNSSGSFILVEVPDQVASELTAGGGMASTTVAIE
ncbi:MAG: SAF domain-containing protein [Propionibacteriaceae bacterium]|nr:SAF domain-containing protein [Propionibacteriaceae bacterium]